MARALRHLPVTILMAAYAVRFSLLSVAVYDSYGSPGFDLGIFDQGIWLLSRFDAPFVTIMGRNLFGDHTSFIVALVVPLYWLWPHAQALLVLQSCLLAAGALPIYALARRLTASTVLATALAATYLLNPALQRGNLEQFHPEAFLALSVATALYAAVERRPVLLAVAVAASLLVKEDTAVLMVPLGVWVALRRDRRWGVTIVVVSAAYMAFAFEVVVKTILGTAGFYAGRLPFGGLGGLVATIFTRPVRLWEYLRSGGRLFYAWQLGISVGLGFVLAPEVAAIAVLGFAENEISTFGYMHQILYHYSLALVPVLVTATVFAIGRLGTAGRRRVATAVVTGCAVVSCVVWGLAPFSLHPYPHADPSSPQVAAIDSVVDALPPHAVVSAYYAYVAHVDHRRRAYQWPTPFAAQYWGLYDMEGQRLPFAGQVTYLLLPSVLHHTAGVLASIASQYRLVREAGGVALYEKL